MQEAPRVRPVGAEPDTGNACAVNGRQDPVPASGAAGRRCARRGPAGSRGHRGQADDRIVGPSARWFPASCSRRAARQAPRSDRGVRQDAAKRRSLGGAPRRNGRSPRLPGGGRMKTPSGGGISDPPQDLGAAMVSPFMHPTDCAVMPGPMCFRERHAGRHVGLVRAMALAVHQAGTLRHGAPQGTGHRAQAANLAPSVRGSRPWRRFPPLTRSAPTDLEASGINPDMAPPTAPRDRRQADRPSGRTGPEGHDLDVGVVAEPGEPAFSYPGRGHCPDPLVDRPCETTPAGGRLDRAMAAPFVREARAGAVSAFLETRHGSRNPEARAPTSLWYVPPDRAGPAGQSFGAVAGLLSPRSHAR